MTNDERNTQIRRSLLGGGTFSAVVSITKEEFQHWIRKEILFEGEPFGLKWSPQPQGGKAEVRIMKVS